MQDQEYKARDKTVRKMKRDGLTEENLYNGGLSVSATGSGRNGYC